MIKGLMTALAVLLVLAACGDGADEGGPRTTTASTESTTTEPATYDVRGTMTLTQANAIDQPGERCNGSGGFDDIRQGTQVTVSDGGGDLLAIGELGSGTKLDVLHCEFDVTVEDVPVADFYEIEVASRGGINYSFEDMEAAGWRVDLTLG